MSYSFTVTVKPDGEMSVVKKGGEIPAGSYTVSGHQDKTYASITVQQHGTDGRYKIAASHGHTAGELEAALEKFRE